MLRCTLYRLHLAHAVGECILCVGCKETVHRLST